MQKAKDHGRVMITRRALTPVRKTAQGPGLVGSAETENFISLSKQFCIPLNDLNVCLNCITDLLFGLCRKLFFQSMDARDGLEELRRKVDVLDPGPVPTGSTGGPVAKEL